jgi:hypothetical protein
MANLWRVLAIAWLGGVASPGLMEDPADIDISSPTSMTSEPASTGSGSGSDREQGGDDVMRFTGLRTRAHEG